MRQMAKLAFLGLGQMGTPMATRLLEAGHDLTVWDRTSARTRSLVDRGAGAGDLDYSAVVATILAAGPSPLGASGRSPTP